MAREKNAHQARLSSNEVDASVKKYLKLLDASCSESNLQTFLSSHAYFFHDFARHHVPIYSKVKLGADYETDFAFYDPSSFGVERHLIEIEKPSHRLFTKEGDISAALSHAMGQVRHWHHWIHNNLQYARSIMPLIEYPFGHIFMGRRSELTATNKERLKRLNFDNRVTMEIRTLDSLASAALSVKPILGHEIQIVAYSHAQLAGKLPKRSFDFLSSTIARHLKSEGVDDLLDERRHANINDFPSE